MAKTERITQSYLAKLANVSQKTVNRALSGHGDVTPETQERIRHLAFEHGYIPNKAAQVMRQGRFNTISLLMTQHAELNFLPNSLISSIMDGIREHKLNLTLSQFTDKELIAEELYPTMLTQLMCDGMLINYPEQIPQTVLDLVKRYRLPAIWMNRKHDQDCAYHNEFEAGKTATEYLIKLGHRRIAFFSTVIFSRPGLHYSNSDRLAGYRQAIADAGLEDLSFTADRYLTLSEKSQAVHHTLTNVKPTAVISYLNNVEMFMYQAAKLGLDIPCDLSILAFGIYSLQTCGMEITTMVQSEEELGRACVELIVKKISNPQKVLKPVVLPVKLTEGQTVSPITKG